MTFFVKACLALIVNIINSIKELKIMDRVYIIPVYSVCKIGIDRVNHQENN